MDDWIIDTNVLLVASTISSGSFKDADHVPAEQKERVLTWLMDFRKDGQRRLVIDGMWKIWAEYRHKMTGQDIGLMVVTEKLQSLARFVDVDYDKDGHGCLPAELEKVIHDPSDRKFVAVALLDVSNSDHSTIVNAVDSDWCDWEELLMGVGIEVIHLIPGLCEGRRRTSK